MKFILLFFFLLAVRTFFGFSQPFFSPDEFQTYLIGLKTYTDGIWPYFGPDLIVTETGFYSQIPGALEGLLIGLPFYVLPIPEAPFILLNLMSLSALACLSWYIAKRVKQIPFLFIFAWLALLPWNLHESTNIINPSWLLFGGVIFFIGFLEAVPETTLKVLNPWTAFAAMGFGIFWCMQFHFSWVLLPPFAVGAFLWRLYRGKSAGVHEMGGLLLGSFFPLLFLIPTLLKFGLTETSSGAGLSVWFNWDNFKAFFTILARYLSLASYELPRFLGSGTAYRIMILKSMPWAILPAVFLVLVGWAQPFIMLFLGFKKDRLHKDWKAIHVITFGALLLVWIGFWFTSKPPGAHMYYILLPLISVYSFYIWGRLAVVRGWRIFGIICLVASLWFEVSAAIRQMPTDSLYRDPTRLKPDIARYSDRSREVKALDQKDYRLLGERRQGSHN
jgi:hypothetical protein